MQDAPVGASLTLQAGVQSARRTGRRGLGVHH